MRRYKSKTVQFFIIILLLNIIIPPIFYAEEQINYELHDGKIKKLTYNSSDILLIDGTVIQLHNSPEGLYYIKSTSNQESYLGFIKKDSTEITFEKKLLDMIKFHIKKMKVCNGIVYLLGTLNKDSTDFVNVLYRIEPNKMDIAEKKDVIDIDIIIDQPVILERSGEETFVQVNDKKLSVAIKGSLCLKRVTDDRLLFISNGDDTEIIDARIMKSLYLYSNKNEYLQPEAFNVIIKTIDEVKENEKIDSENLIFYKVFVNGIESGRTETGLPQVYKIFKEKFETGKYHIIKLERWQLNRSANKYERVNNILQPNTIRILLPENRVMQLEVSFNGSDYKISESVALK